MFTSEGKKRKGLSAKEEAKLLCVTARWHIFFLQLWWHASPQDEVCNHPSHSIIRPENECLLREWESSNICLSQEYQMSESIHCLSGGIITTFCFYVALSPIKFTAWRRERWSVLKEFRISPCITHQTLTTVTEGRNLCWVMNRWCRSDEDSGSLFDWECWKRIKN